jgi:flagellar hook-associated protein 3 FlgL
MVSSVNSTTYAPGTVGNQRNTDALLSLKSQLDDIQRQISSGKKAQTYGDLGVQRVSALSFRNQLGETEGYQNLADIVNVRVSILSQRTSELGKLTETVRTTLLKTRGIGSYTDLNAAKQNVQANFEQFVASLNAQSEGSYLFSGRSRDVKPVLDPAVILNGDGTNAGLKQVIDERRQADLGTTGLGRLTSAVAGTSVTVAEDVAGNPFGIKLVAGSVVRAISNLTTVGPSGSPVSLSLDFTAQPNSSDRFSFNVVLPDGTTKTLSFVADTTGGVDDTTFAIGATPTDTANNLEAAITSRLSSLASTELRSASAVVAAREFFAGSVTNPAARVAGAPFDTSTSYAAPGTRPTVTWYQGDDSTAIAARDTQKAEVATATSVSFGARANEVPFRDAMVAMGVFLAEDYPPNVSTTQDRFDAASARAIDIFNKTGGPAAILEVTTELGRVSSQVSDEKTRHTNSIAFLNNLIGDIEDVKTEEAAAQLLALQTQLQASYQVTSRLAQLSLTQYL